LVVTRQPGAAPHPPTPAAHRAVGSRGGTPSTISSVDPLAAGQDRPEVAARQPASLCNGSRRGTGRSELQTARWEVIGIGKQGRHRLLSHGPGAGGRVPSWDPTSSSTSDSGSTSTPKRLWAQFGATPRRNGPRGVIGGSRWRFAGWARAGGHRRDRCRWCSRSVEPRGEIEQRRAWGPSPAGAAEAAAGRSPCARRLAAKDTTAEFGLKTPGPGNADFAVRKLAHQRGPLLAADSRRVRHRWASRKGLRCRVWPGAPSWRRPALCRPGKENSGPGFCPEPCSGPRLLGVGVTSILPTESDRHSASLVPVPSGGAISGQGPHAREAQKSTRNGLARWPPARRGLEVESVEDGRQATRLGSSARMMNPLEAERIRGVGEPGFRACRSERLSSSKFGIHCSAT